MRRATRSASAIRTTRSTDEETSVAAGDSGASSPSPPLKWPRLSLDSGAAKWLSLDLQEQRLEKPRESLDSGLGVSFSSPTYPQRVPISPHLRTPTQDSLLQLSAHKTNSARVSLTPSPFRIKISNSPRPLRLHNSKNATEVSFRGSELPECSTIDLSKFVDEVHSTSPTPSTSTPSSASTSQTISQRVAARCLQIGTTTATEEGRASDSATSSENIASTSPDPDRTIPAFCETPSRGFSSQAEEDFVSACLASSTPLRAPGFGESTAVSSLQSALSAIGASDVFGDLTVEWPSSSSSVADDEPAVADQAGPSRTPPTSLKQDATTTPDSFKKALEHVRSRGKLGILKPRQLVEEPRKNVKREEDELLRRLLEAPPVKPSTSRVPPPSSTPARSSQPKDKPKKQSEADFHTPKKPMKPFSRRWMRIVTGQTRAQNEITQAAKAFRRQLEAKKNVAPPKAAQISRPSSVMPPVQVQAIPPLPQTFSLQSSLLPPTVATSVIGPGANAAAIMPQTIPFSNPVSHPMPLPYAPLQPPSQFAPPPGFYQPPFW